VREIEAGTEGWGGKTPDPLRSRILRERLTVSMFTIVIFQFARAVRMAYGRPCSASGSICTVCTPPGTAIRRRSVGWYGSAAVS